MSADDFQTKYSSVMEVMLKGAIAETTKLFETMVDELKAEISKIKKENEDLKTKCSQFETERNQPVGTREREPLPGPSDGSDKRDRAVQCDLVPFRTMLVEHCKQLRPSSLQEQQCRYEEMEYSLQDHNYGEPIAQMAFTLAKQKDCDGESSVQMQEEDEPIDICGLVLSDSSEAGSTWESTCGTENEGPLVDPEGSPGGIPLPEKDGEARVALDLPCLEMDRDLQRAQNQSSVSLAEVKDAMENESQGSQKISEAQGELIPSEKQLVVSLHQSEVDLLENKRPSVVPQQCEGLKGGVAEGEASSQPELPVPRRRGRPPKKAKGPKQPVKKKGSPAVSVASLSKRCYNEKEKPSVSHQYSTEIEEGAIQTPFSDVSTAVETLNTPTAQSRERCTSVTLQDAMLLVEAMNQSPVENKFSIPQKVAAAPQTKRAPNASTLETVVEVSAEPGALQFPVETHKAAGNLPVIELSKTTQCTKENLSAAPTTAGAAPTSEAQAHIKVVKPKQQHTIIPSSTTTYLMPSSTAAVQTSVQFLQQHPPTATLITSVAVSKESKAVSPITVMPRSVSSLNPHEIKALSPAQLPAVVSTVVAAQKKSIHPGVKTAVLPLGTPSLSSVPQKTIYVTSGKSFPVVSSLSTATSTDPQSRTVPHPKITIIIPRQVSAVASRKPQSQTIVPTTKQESEKSTVPIEVFSPQFVTSQQELGISVETQTILDKVDTKLFQKRDDTSDNLESRVQTTSESETINAPTETCSSLNMSLGPVPTALSPAVLPTCRQKLSAVVRLTRLPFQVSAKEAVFVSRLSTEGSSETQTISKECTTEEKPSSVVISTQPSDLLLATDICPDAEEASVTLSVNTSQVSGEPNDIQENASLFSENCSILEESPDSGYVQPSTPSKVSPVFDNSTIAVNTTEPPAASGTAGGPTTKSDEERYEDCSLPNGQPIGEKPSTPVTHLTSNTPKDTSDPHLQMTKAQFLAKLAVSPVTQDLQKASFDDPGNATASSSRSDKKMLPEKSVVAKLRSHFKTHLQARRSVTNPEPHTETETSTVIPTNPVNPRLENESPNDKNTPREPIPPNPKHLGSGKDVRSSKMTTNGRTPISPRRSGLRKDGVRPKRNVSEATSVCSMRVKATRKSSPVSHRRSSSGIGSKTKKSSSVSPGKSSPVKESARSRKSKSTLVCPRRSSLIQELASSKKTKATSVSPRRSGSIKESASPKKTESTSVSPRRSNSIKESANSKKTKNISVSPRGTSSSRDGATPKKTKSTISTRMSGLSKNGSTPKVPTSELTYFCRRKCTVTNVGSSSNQVNRESNSFSPRYSITADGAGNETASPSVSWPKLTKDVVTPRNKEDPTAAKKPRLVQDSPGSQKNVRVVDANKLAKAAKAKAMAKIKKSAELLQNGAKISQVADNLASCGTVRKFTAKAVWTPPRVSVSKKTPTGGKKEASSPRSPDQPLVFPPSVSLFPIPIKGPPVVSPLQPLSVIGRRLLKNQCGECGQVLSSIAALESHVSLHKGRRPFSCTLCGKSFPDTKGLKRHGRVHRNGRIHICSHCGKGFVYRFGLTKHLQMVHSRIKPFICQICNRGFFTKRDVEAHIRMHTGEKPFHCNLCEKKFARRVELNVHLRWHNGEKRHWCPFCGKGFLDFNNLKRHKYIHTGEKPHSCPHCPKNFTQSGHLKKHVKNVHKIP